MTDQMLQRKAEQLGKAVQAGDHASALALMGEVAAEAERRGYERGKAEAAGPAQPLDRPLLHVAPPVEEAPPLEGEAEPEATGAGEEDES